MGGNRYEEFNNGEDRRERRVNFDASAAPSITPEQTFTFTAEQIKELVAEHIRTHYGLPVLSADVTFEITPGYDMQGSAPALCAVRAKVRPQSIRPRGGKPI